MTRTTARHCRRRSQHGSAIAFVLVLGASLLADALAWALPWTEVSMVSIKAGFSGDDKAVADIDMDGKPDVIGGTSTSNSTNSLRWWRQVTPTTWTEHVVSGGSHNFTTEMQVGDMDGDGDLDLVVFDAGNHLGYYRNPKKPDGDPTQQSQWVFVDLGSITSAVAHGDGQLDILVRGQYGGTGDAEIWIQKSQTSFTRTSLPGSAGGEGICMGDIDNDGDIDLITATSSAPYTRWYENDGLPERGRWHELRSGWRCLYPRRLPGGRVLAPEGVDLRRG